MPRTAPILAVAALAACGVAAVPAQADAAKRPPRIEDMLRDYDVRFSVQMKSSFKFQPKPNQCHGDPPTPSGWSGAGEEILEMRSPRPVRVQLYTPPDGEAGVTRKDLKSGFEVEGTTRRSGQMTNVVCGKSIPDKVAGCTGKFRIKDRLDVSFRASDSSWLVAGQPSPSTRDQIPSCDDSKFDWDSAVDRTGTVLLMDARGKAARSKLKTKGSFSLTAKAVEQCDADYFGIGTCKTEWSYKATFTRVKGKKRRR